MHQPMNRASMRLDAESVTPDYYIEHYMDFLPRYISHGRPTADTLTTYQKRIRSFLQWCEGQGIHPLAVQDYQMRIFMEDFILAHKDSTVALTLIAIRTFFMVALRLGFIRENPCAHIHAGAAFRLDEDFKYFTLDQVGEVLHYFESEKDDFVKYRNMSMLYLMSVEGLRNVEIERMNDEDIHWETETIYIRGKGHAGVIYPSQSTMKTLKKYLEARPKPVKDGALTPTFLSDSHRRMHQRLSRDGIRKIMDKGLRACGYKQKGISCHVFRHSCGTNLYAATKDLRIVQETLRQRDPKTTARYAHVHQRMTKRYTSALDPENQNADQPDEPTK